MGGMGGGGGGRRGGAGGRVGFREPPPKRGQSLPIDRPAFVRDVRSEVAAPQIAEFLQVRVARIRIGGQLFVGAPALGVCAEVVASGNGPARQVVLGLLLDGQGLAADSRLRRLPAPGSPSNSRTAEGGTNSKRSSALIASRSRPMRSHSTGSGRAASVLYRPGRKSKTATSVP